MRTRSSIVSQRAGANAVVPSVPADQPDRRLPGRVRTSLRVAHVTVDQDHGFARIVNISNQGLGLQLHFPVTPGDRLVVRLAEDQSVVGRIAWTGDTNSGVEFLEPIDSSALLKNLADQARLTHPRSLRMPVNRPAAITNEKGCSRLVVRDLSLGGMKFEHDGSYLKGSGIKVQLASGTERSGVIRWSRSGLAGVVFPVPFHPRDLGSANIL